MDIQAISPCLFSPVSGFVARSIQPCVAGLKQLVCRLYSNATTVPVKSLARQELYAQQRLRIRTVRSLLNGQELTNHFEQVIH